jgi:REP element-mobilizing transposase RayT/ActR/RegA family two-component response regulator
MDKSVLLVTPQASLEDVVRRALKNVGNYDLQATNDFGKVLKGNRQQPISWVLLDAELEDQGISILDVGRAFRQLNDKVQFIVITNPRSWLTEEINELAPRGFISKPLDAAELAHMMNDVNPSNPRAETPAPRTAAVEVAPELPWLQDINRAAQHLTRLTLESSAQAALINLNNELWAYAGQLSKAAAQEISQTIQRYWDHEEKSDLLRFIRLDATKAEHMLYATRLSPAMILALVFDAETPFSTIRTQAGKLAGSLAATPPPDAHRDNRRREAEESVDLPQLSEVLSDVPPPNPSQVDTGWEASSTSAATSKFNQPTDELESSLEHPAPAAPSFSVETSPPVLLGSTRQNEAEHEIADSELYFDEAALAVTRKHVPTPDESAQFAETRRHTVDEQRQLEAAQQRSMPEGARKIVLEPVSPALYNLCYACLLIPRFDRHYLTGDLADRVTDWMQDVCIAYGWRLEHIAVRPEYLQWIANVPPAVSPGFIMRIVRQQISARIFSDFPRFAKENPSGDFWAPGYLIMGGPQPHPSKLIKDFIQQTRQRQGISRPLR